MDLQKCLHYLSDPSGDESVIYFQAGHYPLLFFSLFFTRYKNIHPVDLFTVVDMSSISFAQLQCQLQTSFLGSNTIYWLKDISLLEKSTLDLVVHYLEGYKGPNKVMLFVPEGMVTTAGIPTNYLLFILPNYIKIEDIYLLAPLIGGPSKGLSKMIEKASSIIDKISLDEAILLLHYSHLLGSHMDVFFTEWIHYIIKPEVSLFLLSQYFFAKKETLFFKMWKKIEGLYNEAFWMVYWSEQLWRAAMYIALRAENNIGEAKKIAYKLPFSFINNDWRCYSIEELKNAHQFLYENDYQLKNGGSVIGLDLFYTAFFLQKYSKV